MLFDYLLSDSSFMFYENISKIFTVDPKQRSTD